MGFLRRRSPPPAPQYIAPPPREEIMDYIDKVSGVQVLTVNGPDGRKRRVKERLPRTPEEEQRYVIGEQMIARALQNINELYQYDPANVVNFAPLIETFSNLNKERISELEQVANLGNIREDVQAFKDMQSTLDDQMFRRQNREIEENLGRKGLSNSYAGQEARAFAARNQDLTRKQTEFNANLYGEEVAAKRLDRNAQAYALNETGREAQLAAAEGEYQLRRDQLADIEAKRQTAIQENMNALNVGSGLTGQDMNKALSSNAEQLALSTFQAQNADSLQRYTAGVNARNAAYDRQLSAYNSRPPSFSDIALRAGGAFGNAILTASPNSFAGRIGGKLAGRVIPNERVVI